MRYIDIGKRNLCRRWGILFFLAVMALGVGLFHPPNALGQGATAAMNGSILDPADLAVTDARIALKNLDTGTEQIAVTNSEGRYVFVGLKPGRYSLRVIKQGFSTASIPEFALAVDQTLTQDAKLVVGSTSVDVTVAASSVSVDTTTTELGTAIETKEVNDLPRSEERRV